MDQVVSSRVVCSKQKLVDDSTNVAGAVSVGATVGASVGATVGVTVGANVGTTVGANVGTSVGETVSVKVGICVGTNVGSLHISPLNTAVAEPAPITLPAALMSAVLNKVFCSVKLDP